MELNQLSGKVIAAAINVHNILGPGLLETVYNKCLMVELEAMGLKTESEVPLPIVYKGETIIQSGYRLDLVVEDTIVVELKSVESIQPIHKKQLLTYVRLAGKPLGLLINFNEVLLRDGITRIVNVDLAQLSQ
jgi:GxxExxY protein